MSTLLELKSSVLRQVQRSQSLRSRREPPPPTATGNTADAIPPYHTRVSERTILGVAKGNGEFFERMNKIIQKQDSLLAATQVEEENIAGPPPTECTDKAFIPEKATRNEMDLLYEEAVYTVVNRVGVPSPEYVSCEGDLFNYLQKTFDMGQEEHDIILQRVKESKRASFSLRVSVMKGKNLMAKDANGYSDPYCMLGILLGQGSRDTEERKERKFSFRKRKEKLEKRSSVREVLAARDIQVTEVKTETLNPVWNEHFVFDIDDVQNDLLHLDIWDHDDDVSVAEACRKLNEISGLRGMGRYFKQIAKSVRANGSAASGSEENADDFLGCLNIPLSEIPVVGYDKWFKLEPRSSASRVQGECHLILKLFTTQRDTTLTKMVSNVVIHQKMLSQILEYEHRHIQKEPYNWNGQVSPAAWTVLSHHAVQADLSPLQQAIIRWHCYSSHHRAQRLCYSLLLRLLRAVGTEWETGGGRNELESVLAKSFKLYCDFCLSLMKGMRQVFPCTNPAAITRCELMLRTIGQIQSMQVFKDVCPNRKELHLEIATVIKKGTVEWYEGTISHFKPDEGTLEEQLERLVLVVDAVCVDVQRGLNVYNKLFHSSVKVDFFSISYRQLEKLVADDVNVAMERVCGTLEQESSRLSQTMGETLFELFMSLKTLKRFREFLPLKDTKMLALTGFHNWFKTSIHKWLQIVHEKSVERICKAVEMDQLEPVHKQAKHSSSAVDLSTCFSQVREFWMQLSWPDSAGAFIFITRLTDNFCSEAVSYSELLKRKVERSQLGGDHRSFTVQLCVALNDAEHVRLYLAGLPRELGWQSVEQAMEESCGAEGKEQVNKALNGQLYNADLDLQREVKRLITHLTDKMLPELRRCIQHIGLSPDTINNDDAVSPLMKYLETTLVILSESLVKENLSRVLQSLWELLLRMILDSVAENRGVQVEFYTRFQYTIEKLVRFFHANGEGLLLEDLKSGDYKVLEEELRLNKCSSFELIEQYFLEKISQQRILKHSRFGRISVKCYYDAPEQRLTVEILHAADLIALDANGLSDPFVIIELCPHHLFPNSRSQRTQVKLKTLHPVFDEVFYFHVSPEQYRHRCACLTFTVMDYDWLSTNDFAGEAVSPLSDFCWPGRPNATPAGKNLQPFILHLSRQKPSEKPIMRMLEARTGDREAQEFVRRLKEIEKSMEEE
ncbi:BAI1-associated protein 3 isoform X1 [Electrophorus electricus]|uniref:BAI1-associated protein 3 isoform X1 n=1 Tax=Electrophorus electricus TaxID=8005 RepID=UPI0015CFA26A|nr:BAI1-associated protein 3 isoform X1 [Electrophorus electricus]